MCDIASKARTRLTTGKDVQKALNRFTNNPTNPDRKTPKLSKHDHYKSHRAGLKKVGLDYKSADAYAKGAQKFLNNPPKGTLTKVRLEGDNKGDVIRFNEKTGEYGVMTKNGLIKTYFAPSVRSKDNPRGFRPKFKDAKEYFYGG